MSTAELAAIRADAEATLPSTCNIVSLSTTRDARGQVTEVSVTGPNFACAVDPIDMAREVETAARIGTTRGWRISMPLAVVLSENDMIGLDVEGESGVLNVVGADGPQSDAALRVVLAAEGA